MTWHNLVENALIMTLRLEKKLNHFNYISTSFDYIFKKTIPNVSHSGKTYNKPTPTLLRTMESDIFCS